MANENLKNGPVNPDAENDEEMTVTLTLDDGTELECVVLTIFEAGEKEYIALLPLDGREAEDERFTYTVMWKISMEIRIWRTLTAMRSMRSWQTPLTSFWTPQSTTSWSARTRWNRSRI